jgi:hypothetical protein
MEKKELLGQGISALDRCLVVAQTMRASEWRESQDRETSTTTLPQFAAAKIVKSLYSREISMALTSSGPKVL